MNSKKSNIYMKNINVFYHIYSIDGVESIIDDQIDKLIKHKESFNFFINIDISSGYNLPNDTLNKIKLLSSNITYTYESRYEISTLSLMYKHALENDDYYLYIHTKGSTRVNSSNTEDAIYPYENVGDCWSSNCYN